MLLPYRMGFAIMSSLYFKKFLNTILGFFLWYIDSSKVSCLISTYLCDFQNFYYWFLILFHCDQKKICNMISTFWNVLGLALWLWYSLSWGTFHVLMTKIPYLAAVWQSALRGLFNPFRRGYNWTLWSLLIFHLDNLFIHNSGVVKFPAIKLVQSVSSFRLYISAPILDIYI